MQRVENDLAIEVGNHQGANTAVPQLTNVAIDVEYVYGEPKLIDSKPQLLETMRPRDLSIGELPLTLDVGRHAVQFQLSDDGALSNNEQILRHGALRMKVSNYTYYDEFDVRINGQLLPPEERRTRAVFIMNNDSTVTYPLDPAVVRAGQNTLEIEVRKLNPAISVTPKLLTAEVLVEP